MKMIPLSQNCFTMVDDEDYEVLNKHRWHASVQPQNTYVERNVPNPTRASKQSRIKMHRLLTGAKPGQVVDHIDGNGLNNQKSNLRLCNHAENRQNCRRSYRTKSGYKGVHKMSSPKHHRSPWHACIKANRKTYSLGYHSTPEKAAIAYDKKAIELHGKFAKLNFPENREAYQAEINRGADAMTLPDERYWAVIRTRDFLQKLLNPKESPKVPGWVREEARRCLKHYPGEYDLNRAAGTAPHVFQIPEESPDAQT